MSSQRKKHTLTIDVDLLKEIKILAIKRGISFGEAIEEAIQDYIQKHME